MCPVFIISWCGLSSKLVVYRVQGANHPGRGETEVEKVVELGGGEDIIFRYFPPSILFLFGKMST